MQDTLIDAAAAYIGELFRDNADGHDAEHSLRVYRTAMRIAADYPECDSQIVALAALLHDADDHKLFDTRDNANTRQFLTAQQVESGRIEKICRIINGVSFSQNKGKTPDTLEGMIVQDADRLDAIGAVGIARTFAYGGRHGRSLDASIQHFYDKLLLLRDGMHTETARKLAAQRHALMEDFLTAYRQETQCE